MADAERRSLQLIKISELKPAARNARTHSKRQIKQIADSIKCAHALKTSDKTDRRFD